MGERPWDWDWLDAKPRNFYRTLSPLHQILSLKEGVDLNIINVSRTAHIAGWILPIWLAIKVRYSEWNQDLRMRQTDSGHSNADTIIGNSLTSKSLSLFRKQKSDWWEKIEYFPCFNFKKSLDFSRVFIRRCLYLWVREISGSLLWMKKLEAWFSFCKWEAM